jgi:hypothetical protein
MPTGKPKDALAAAAAGGPLLESVKDGPVSPAGPVPPAAPGASQGAEAFVAARTREQVPREVLNVALPAEFAVLRRMRMVHALTGVQLRDQALMALDKWLNEQGYPASG